MARCLFFGLPVHGHTNPTLPLVRELSRRGDDVIYLSTTEFADTIAATGATFRPYRNAFLPELGAIARRMDELVWLFARTSSEVLEEELEDFRALRPDYLITDSVAPWGQWVAQVLDLPVMTSVTTFGFNRKVLRYAVAHGVRPKGGSFMLSKLRHMARAMRLTRQLRRRYGVRGPGFFSTALGPAGPSLVYTSRAFQPCADSFDERVSFVGPLLETRTDADRFSWEGIRDPVVYVSLGTLFNADPAFYRMCFEALRRLDVQVVLSVGRRISIPDLGTPPANVLVRAHVPQLEILKRASAFVTHGGMNSVSEGLFYGVPLVVVPQMSEQYIVGRRVEELGAGVFMTPEAVTADSLHHAVARLLLDDTFSTAARAIGESFRVAGGVTCAADVVQGMTRSLSPAPVRAS